MIVKNPLINQLKAESLELDIIIILPEDELVQLHPFLSYMRNAIQVLMFKYRIRDAKIYNNTILYQKLIINLPQCDVYVSFIPVEFTFVINTMESPGTEFFFCCCLTQKGVFRDASGCRARASDGSASLPLCVAKSAVFPRI